MANKTQLLQCNIDLKPGQDSKSCTPRPQHSKGCLHHIYSQGYNVCTVCTVFVLMVKVGGLGITKCRIPACEVTLPVYHRMPQNCVSLAASVLWVPH